MKIVASLVAVGLVIGGGCTDDEPGTAGTATSPTSTSVTDASSDTPASTAGPATTIGTSSTTAAREDAISFEILEQTDRHVLLLVFDSSGRNAADISFGGAPETLVPRPIYVLVKRATAPDGTLVTDDAVRLQVVGGYHDNGSVACPYDTTDTAVMCIGFARMDYSKYELATFDYRDIPNHLVDVSTALDVLLDNPRLTTPIDPERIFYLGVSMGGITGSLFVHPDFFDERIEAVVSLVGGFPFWIDGMSDRSNYDAGPPILMVNTMKDSIITYEFAKLSLAAAQGSSNVELLSLFEGEHADFMTCPAAIAYQSAWIDHHVNDGPPPDPSVFDESECAAFGPQEGGTTGFGPRDDLFPDDAKALFVS